MPIFGSSFLIADFRIVCRPIGLDIGFSDVVFLCVCGSYLSVVDCVVLRGVFFFDRNYGLDLF